jgi:branched-chain amino acid transport system substrate-binding protein
VFRLPQSVAVMAFPLVEHMKKHGVKTVGFFGYTDGYGESWLKTSGASRTGRHQGWSCPSASRAANQRDAAGLKLVAASGCDHIAAGSAAAMPQGAHRARLQGQICQTHGAATPSRSHRRQGCGAATSLGPAVMASNCPTAIRRRARPTTFEKAYGPGTRNQFAGHAYDAHIVLAKALPVALKKAKPGTPEVRAALRDAIEGMGRTVLAHGVINWTASDHGGYTNETGVMLKVVNGSSRS